MENTVKDKQDLNRVLKILCEAAFTFRDLDEAADRLFANKDIKGYAQKLKEKANLLVNLPYKLEVTLNEVNPEFKEEIELKVQYFANIAERMLKDDNKFGMAALLTHKGHSVNDKNDLEKLIDYIMIQIIN